MNFKSLFYKTLDWCSDHSAEICTGVAVVTSVAAVATTVKATKDVIPELERHSTNIGAIKKSWDEENQEYLSLEVSGDNADVVPVSGSEGAKLYRKDLTKEYAKAGLTVAKYYAVPIILEITAVATIISSNKISREKNAALAGSLTCLQAAYDKYRQNVIEAVGEEKERDIRLGLHNEKVTTETVDEETGKTKKVKEDAKVVDPDKMAGLWTYIYDEKADNFNKSRGVNRDTLLIKQSYWNDYLIRRGRVFVNEVLEDIGLGCYCTPMGQYYGWVYDPTGESDNKNCIRFNIEDDIRFMGTYDPSVIITLEPDGNILGEAFNKEPKITKKAWANASY